jgi:hypothetical protein
LKVIYSEKGQRTPKRETCPTKQRAEYLDIQRNVRVAPKQGNRSAELTQKHAHSRRCHEYPHKHWRFQRGHCREDAAFHRLAAPKRHSRLVASGAREL